MKYSDITQLNDGELQKNIEETRDALRITRFSLAVGKLKENNQYKFLRRDLARFLTEQKDRRLRKEA
jgi:ribosomal protein L29